ncbi:hypothetical protein KIF59_06195 [Enterobacter cloacae subsp. cloacae]|nr:hypothetical protein [Enterobacter cloacae subsp. cloacae]
MHRWGDSHSKGRYAASIDGGVVNRQPEVWLRKLDSTKFDATKPETYNYVSEVETFDSLGNRHAIKVFFVNDGDGKWKAFARGTQLRRKGG